MATTASSPPRSATVSQSETYADPSPPSVAPENQSQPPPSASASATVNPRRPPPPCWSPDETTALIEVYRGMWHSLGRAALKVNHWQEVADAVACRCPVSSPPKTATQCRHKMEKLRKRYRAEIRRAESLPKARFTSSWVHFKRMEAMDRSRSGSDDDDDDDDDDEDEDMDLDYPEPRNRKKVRADAQSSGRHIYYPNGIGAETVTRNRGRGGFRIKIPTTGREKFKPSKNVNSDGEGSKWGQLAGKRQGHSADPLQEVISAIKFFREGFERMEKMKIDMVKEIGQMQRQMETKRTKMILDSQQFMVETLAKVISDKKKKRRKSEEAPETISTPQAEA